MVKALLDSGASKSIITTKAARDLKQKSCRPQHWQTYVGTLSTGRKTSKSTFNFPELHANKEIRKSLHMVTDGLTRHDMIIGRDLINKLGIDIKCSNMSIYWDDAAIPWRNMDSMLNNTYLTYSPTHQPDKKTSRKASKILDTRYEPANLKEITDAAEHVTPLQRKNVYKLLIKYKDQFDGTLGKWNSTPYDIKLKECAEPYHARALPVPKIHELTLKKELDRLCTLQVLKKVNRSRWGAPTFIIPKKNNSVCFTSDFRVK
jgi:hypothetical protein